MGEIRDNKIEIDEKLSEVRILREKTHETVVDIKECKEYLRSREFQLNELKSKLSQISGPKETKKPWDDERIEIKLECF